VAFSELAVRLAKVLLRAAADGIGGHKAQRGSKVGTSQRELATMVGAARESVNRCMREWQRSGFVRLHEGWIILADREALARIASD
jgi:CRP/FNR family transcriptional regulator, cyclic AMP receptor protein